MAVDRERRETGPRAEASVKKLFHHQVTKTQRGKPHEERVSALLRVFVTLWFNLIIDSQSHPHRTCRNSGPHGWAQLLE